MTKVDPLLKIVAEECHVPVRCIVSRVTCREYNRPRQVYAYVAHNLFGDSFEDISVVLGRANHSTSWKAYHRVARNRAAYEPALSRILARFQATEMAA